MKAYVYNKDYLKVRKGLKVLEVGPGNNPTKRADVLIEKFVQDNTHRRGDLKIFKHQKLVQADGENIPFLEDLFDGSELEDNLSDKKNLPTESGVYKCVIRFHSFKSNRPDDPEEWDSNITIESCELIEISFD